MAHRYYHRRNSHWILYVVIAIAAATCAWFLWPGGQSADSDLAGNGGTRILRNPNPATRPSIDNVVRIDRTVRTVKTTTRPSGKSSPAALRKFRAGNAAFAKQKHLEARGLLSEVLIAGGLAEDLAQEAREKLAYLSSVTLFARTIDPRDPYTMRYKFKRGDHPAAVERRLKLHVPSQLIVQVNGLSDASKFLADADYKLIKGPFHAIVYKSIYKMDMILHRREENLPPVFIKRYDVGLGQNNSTPTGLWRLGCGALIDEKTGKRERGKLLKARWNPPPNAIQRRSIEYNMPGYPFGVKGIWISLVGLDANTRPLIDYGIHSTDDQSSIGKQASMGCIRMRDNDIQEVYDRLYEKWSTVRIVP